MDRDLINIKSEVLRPYFQDGSVETTLGLMLPVLLRRHIGQEPTPMEFVSMGVIFVLLTLQWYWRKRVTYPRLGYIGFHNWRQAFSRESRPILWKGCAIGLFVGAAMGVVFAYLRISSGAQAADSIVPPFSRSQSVMPLAFVTVVVPLLQKFRNWYFMGMGVGVFLWILLCDFLRIPNLWAIGPLSTALIIIGMVKLMRFLRTHPKLEAAA